MRALVILAAACSAPPARPAPAPPPAPPAVVVAPPDAAAPPDASTDSCATTAACVALGERILVGAASYSHHPAAAVAANTRALALFRAACAQDHAAGCGWVGTVLEDYQYYAVPQDAESAALAFDKGCRLGDAHACYRQGFAIWEGLLDHIVDDHGTLRRIAWPADKRIGAARLRRACDLHDEDACKLLDDLRKAGAL